MTKCPCEQCISFALCNASLKERLKETPPYLTTLHVLVLPKLVNCLALHKYLNVDQDWDSSDWNIERLCKTRDAFNLGGSND